MKMAVDLSWEEADRYGYDGIRGWSLVMIYEDEDPGTEIFLMIRFTGDQIISYRFALTPRLGIRASTQTPWTEF